MHCEFSNLVRARLGALVVVILSIATAGCANEPQKQRPFFTSGSREADQRAEQRVAKDEQLRGGSGKSSDRSAGAGVAGKDPADNAKKSLYERLGGEQGITAIVDDFITRALADPRVNWERKGVKRSALSLKWKRSVDLNLSPDDVVRLKLHMVQFLALATGGPPTYEGREMRQVHQGLVITNAEFDAAVGDLKATLDKLGVATPEQKELLSIIESTRPQVVEER
jgi:hemoglobin